MAVNVVLQNVNADGSVNLTVDHEGLLSLWDSEVAARKSDEGEYVKLYLTSEQIGQLIIACVAAKRRNDG